METYQGYVKTPADAIILFEACRLGQLPRVQRRLSDKERQSIRSGSVFVWDEREAGMRRWTDGKSWSASRVNGSFLTYREMEGKRTPTAKENSLDKLPRDPSKPTSRDGELKDDSAQLGDTPDGYRYKPDGLTKQSFSITTSQGQHLHLISYFARSHLQAATLLQPTTDPSLRHVRPAKGMYPESTLQDSSNTPAMTSSPMLSGPFAGSPSQHSAASTPQYAHSRHTAHTYPPAFPWPPSPLNTPPVHHHSPYQHSPYQHSPYTNGYPSGSLAHSPFYNGHPAYPNHHRAPTGPTAFDRLPGSGPNALPPASGPPPPVQNGYHAPPPLPPAQPQYQQSPRIPPPPSHSVPQYSPSANRLPPYQPSTSQEGSIDPSLAPGATQSRTLPGPQPDLRAKDPPRSSAGTIPSIGALINNTPPEDPPIDTRPPFPLQPSDHLYGAAHDKRPPFSADKSLLRKLDKAFAA